MRRARRTWWFIYGLGATVAIVALAVVTSVTLHLERAEREARAQAAQQENLRLALWRMDSWLAPFLSREAARPYFEYLPFYPPERAYTKILNVIEPGEVLTPSPLLEYESEYFPLHFQVTPDGELTSPEAPTGNFRDLAEGHGVSNERINRRSSRLQALANDLGLSDLRDRVVAVEACVAGEWMNESPATGLDQPSQAMAAQQSVQIIEAQQEQELWMDFQKRSKLNIENQQMLDLPPTTKGLSIGYSDVLVGPFAPIWLASSRDTDGGELRLAFIRRVRIGADEILQGILADWPHVREAMLTEIEDLFPEAKLIPDPDGFTLVDDPAPRSLATIPATLHLAATPATAPIGMTPARWALGLTWSAVLISIIAIGLSLQGVMLYAQKRARFASAVTHELRTPLTTFRLYSEMLAGGMAPEERRRSYLDTLAHESRRLSHLVENVLAYARLEERRVRKDGARPVTIAELVAQVESNLGERCADAGAELRVIGDVHSGAMVQADADVVQQVLFNLVDNACKYAVDDHGGAIELEVETGADCARFRVRDHGPGVSPALATRLFRPFERGADNEAKPGIGLGLALARGLARDLGGDLRLRKTTGNGSCFELSLPLAK